MKTLRFKKFISLFCVVAIIIGVVLPSALFPSEVNAAPSGSSPIEETNNENPLRDSSIIQNGDKQSSGNIGSSKLLQATEGYDYEIRISNLGSATNIWIYNNSGNLSDGVWPGFSLTADSEASTNNGKYKITYENGESVVKFLFNSGSGEHIIINNGTGGAGNQTGDITLSSKGVYSFDLSRGFNGVPTSPSPQTSYAVGTYNYTGRYLTFNSEFFDYLSDNEINKGAIDDSKASGWTDQHQYFNKAISGIVETRNTDGSTRITLNGSAGCTNIHYWPVGSSGGTTWPGTSLSNMTKDEAGRIKIQNYGDNIKQVGVIFNKGSSGPQTGNITLDAGYNYKITVNSTMDSLGQYTFSVQKESTSNCEYKYPLYFGCFYYGNNDGDYNSSSYAEAFSKNSSPLYQNFYWLANIAKRGNADMSASVSGLVSEKLKYEGSTPVLAGASSDGTGDTVLPYFSEAWFNSHTVTNNKSLANITHNVDFPFYEVELTKDSNGNALIDSTGNYPIYYQYNSRDRASLFLDSSNSNKGKLYEHTVEVRSQDTVGNGSGSTKGFYPYNEFDTSIQSGQKLKNNLAFGTRFDMEFSLSEDGEINGIPATFEFMGDDDVWVYVDGKLALDMGGAHKDAYGKIDFSTGVATLSKSIAINDTNKDSLSAAIPVEETKTGFIEKESNGLYDTQKVHTLTMFYMERGMYESDLFVRFNFTRQNNFTVENEIDCSNINDGLKARTMQAANLDLFEYDFDVVENNPNLIDNVNGVALKFESGEKENITRTVKLNGKTVENTSVAISSGALGVTDSYTPHNGAVSDVVFSRYDDYVADSNGIPNVNLTGKTDGGGLFALLYSQSASFKYRFYSDSKLSLVQNESLKRLNMSGNQPIERLKDESTRKVSSYYNTKWELTDTRSEVKGSSDGYITDSSGITVKDDGSSNISFNNKTIADEDYILGTSVKATLTNAPKTGTLKISKSFPDADIDNEAKNTEFDIKLTLTDVFGQQGVNTIAGDSIEYTVGGVTKTAVFGSNSTAVIKLKPGETAEISGVPVGTKWQISEDTQGSFVLDNITNADGSSGESTAPESTVTNKRNFVPVTLNVQKICYDKDGKVLPSQPTKEFNFDLTLEADSFDLAGYYNKYKGTTFTAEGCTLSVDGNKLKSTFKVSPNAPKVITLNVPVGTKITLKEQSGEGYTFYPEKSSASNITLNDNGEFILDNVSGATTADITAANKIDEPEVTKGSVTLTKVDKSDNNIKLSGVEFKLEKLNDANGLIDTTFTAITDSTDSNGAVTFSDLPLGEYRITETKAKAGYELLTEPIDIVLTADSPNITRTVENVKSIQLPNTGGTGTILFTIGGIAIIAVAVLLYIFQWRKSKRKNCSEQNTKTK